MSFCGEKCLYPAKGDKCAEYLFKQCYIDISDYGKAEKSAAEKPAAAHLVPEDLADMTVANLKKMAADMGIDTKALKTKDALIQAICAEEVYPGEPMDGPDLGAEAPVV